MKLNKKIYMIFSTLLLFVASCGEKRSVLRAEIPAYDSAVLDHIPNTIPFRPVANTCLKPWLRQDRCSFYRECLEAGITCENTAFPYAISYGEKYCNKFQGLQLSTRGEAWKRGAMLCLQESVRLSGENGQTHDGQGNVHGTCQEVRELEFTGHVSCYLGGPGRFSKRVSHSVCALSPGDWKQIILVVEAADVVTKDSLIQIRAVASRCVVDIKNKLLGISPPGPNWPTSSLTTPAEDNENVAFLEQKIREYDTKLSGGAIAMPAF